MLRCVISVTEQDTLHGNVTQLVVVVVVEELGEGLVEAEEEVELECILGLFQKNVTNATELDILLVIAKRMKTIATDVMALDT